jgi:ammonium transporter, Amt family
VVFAVGFFDKLKIDDPVGATSVHLFNGVWGTLAVGLFSQGDLYGVTPAPKAGLFFGGGFEQLSYQLIGTVAVAVTTVVLSAIFWAVLKAVVGIRVTPEEEFQGLDITEHGMEAYAGFSKESLSGGPEYSSREIFPNDKGRVGGSSDYS